MKSPLLLLVFLIQVSCLQMGYGLNIENSHKVINSLKESPGPKLNIPMDSNSTETNILNALAAVLPIATDTKAQEKSQKEKKASELSYFEPQVLYTTIPIIVICMVAIALLAEYFGDGLESGR